MEPRAKGLQTPLGEEASRGILLLSITGELYGVFHHDYFGTP